MNMKKMMLMLVALFSMTVAMAQNANGRQPRKMDATTVTTMMTTTHTMVRAHLLVSLVLVF